MRGGFGVIGLRVTTGGVAGDDNLFTRPSPIDHGRKIILGFDQALPSAHYSQRLAIVWSRVFAIFYKNLAVTHSAASSRRALPPTWSEISAPVA